MTEAEAIEIVMRNGTSVFDDKRMHEFFTDWEMSPEERDSYNEAKNFLLNECNYTMIS